MSYQRAVCDVVIPCRDEAPALPALLAKLPFGFRAVGVDDGFPDGTVEVARGLGASVVDEPWPGYSAAVHAGLVAASADHVAVMDGDESMDHEDATAASGASVVRVGMDTPHLEARSLVEGAARLTHPDGAVLGPAYDGGWWLLGVGGQHVLSHLRQVPMSTGDTGSLTREALISAGARATDVERLRDVDEVADAESVAANAPGTRFARAFVGTAR